MTSPQPDVRLVGLAAAYQAQTSALRDKLSSYMERLWASLGSYRVADMHKFVQAALPVVSGGQRQMVSVTAAFLAVQKQLAIGGPGTPAAANPDKLTGAAARNGTAMNDVYSRPFHLVWRQLDESPRQPGSIEKAIQAGLDRSVQLAMTDLQLAKTHTVRQIVQHDDRVKWTQRILEGAYSCGLCIVASTQRYKPQELMPMHPACDCSQQIVYGNQDPGLVVEPATLADVHARVQERFGVSSPGARAIPRKGLPDYKDVLIVHEHGELGPVLGVRGQPFLGPNDL